MYEVSKYKPECVDVWSLGIIFCCMALRRFPWKLPRTSDVSYKYFITEPSPGAPSEEEMKLISHGRVKSRSSVSGDESKSSKEAGGEQRKATSAGEVIKGTVDRPETPQGKEAQPTTSIKGPWRLLRLLPRESRYIVGRMLDTNPDTRATLEDVREDAWISKRTCCCQEDGGQVVRAAGHDHVLEPGGKEAPDPGKK